MLPLARELASRGWEVTVAASEPFGETVRRRGLEFVAAGLPWLESEAERTFPELATMSLDEQGYWWVSDIFADRAARPMAADLIQLCRTWRPDLIVRDYWEFGGWAAAESTGIPCAVMGLAMHAPADELAPFIGHELDAVRTSVGLPSDPGLSSLYRGLYVDLLPASYQVDEPPDAVRMRPVEVATAPAPVARRTTLTDDRPMVLVTFGTVFNHVPGVFETVLEALADQPLQVMMTTGPDRDPAQLGPLPSNVSAQRFIPYDTILPQCAAVVCHAGFGTIMAALAHDVPIVAVPLSADQPIHATRCEQLGLGVQITHDELTPGALVEALGTVLDDTGLQRRVARVGEELRAMPGPDAAADRLERLVPAPRTRRRTGTPR